jgi:hypothetical protein
MCICHAYEIFKVQKISKPYGTQPEKHPIGQRYTDDEAIRIAIIKQLKGCRKGCSPAAPLATALEIR